jgi:hypothetical protein
LSFGDEAQHAGLEDVDAHADLEVERRLFDVVLDGMPAVELDDAQVDVHVAGVHGDGGDAAAGLVEGDQVGHPQVGQHVAVAHQEGLVEIIHQRQRSGRAERAVFHRIVDRDAELLARSEEGLDQAAQVPDRDDHLVNVAGFHLADEDLQNGHTADGHQRLGEDMGVRGQTSAFAPCKDDGFHGNLGKKREESGEERVVKDGEEAGREEVNG